jgi:hypothetical protein
MSRPKPPAPQPPATPSSTDDFAADLAALEAGGDDDFGAELAALDAPAPEKPSGAGAMAAGGAFATLAAGVPLARRIAEHVATSPTIGRAVSGVTRAAGPLNLGVQAYEVVSGRKRPLSALKDAILGEGARQGAKLAYRATGPVASALGAEGVAGMAAPVAVPLAGGLAGVAGTAGFLGALQHDANRHVDIDYSKQTPDTDIAKVLTQMMTSEATKGRTRDERMDDPSDVMFRADDAEEVRPNGQPRSPGLLDSILALMR